MARMPKLFLSTTYLPSDVSSSVRSRMYDLDREIDPKDLDDLQAVLDVCVATWHDTLDRRRQDARTSEVPF